MAGKFDDAKPGDQVEMPAHRRSTIWGADDSRNPDRVVQVGIITDRWYDPVEQKEYVGIAILKRGGVYGPPTRKHTIRGMASNGWRPASKDWIAWAKAVDAPENLGKVVPISGRRPATPRAEGKEG